MTKVITIKLVQTGPTAGPFIISDPYGNVIAENVSRKTLIKGISYVVDASINQIVLTSTGKCTVSVTIQLKPINIIEYQNTIYTQSVTGCLWRHLTNIEKYNDFYGHIEPYIIEYPFAYQFQDEILQNVKDYTKAYEYLPIPDGVFNDNVRIETNNKWFNQAIVYNSQQNSGLLNLVAKPLNNLKAYNSYPIYNTDSKTIMYTKSDNFYQYNTFWNVQINSQLPAFNTTCESLSVDKTLNQSNMDYGMLSFKKATIRAKDLRVRHILNNSSTTHLVSQFITTGSQISYK
jgi:hypothetical protein